MKTTPIALLAACVGLAQPAFANTSAYDLLIVACDNRNCTRVAEQTVFRGLGNSAEYNSNGLRVMIETMSRRTHEEDARVSLNVAPNADVSGRLQATARTVAQRIETLVVQCTLRHGTFSPLTSFVSDGTTYQIWARLAAMR